MSRVVLVKKPQARSDATTSVIGVGRTEATQDVHATVDKGCFSQGHEQDQPPRSGRDIQKAESASLQITATLQPVSEGQAFRNGNAVGALPPTPMGPQSTRIPEPHSCAALIPTGFILRNTIPMFGSTVYADFYEYHGPTPPVHDLSDGVPIYELALVKGDLSLHQLFPELSTSAFAHIVISNVMVVHQTALFDKTKAVGWTLEGDITIGAETGGLYDILSNILFAEGLSVRFNAQLGDSKDRSWLAPSALHALALEGTLVAQKHPLSQGLVFTQLVIRLLAAGDKFSTDRSSSLAYTYEVLGCMHLAFPPESNPVQFKFRLAQGQGDFEFTATPVDDLWKDALSIPGLSLIDTSLTASLKPNWNSRVDNFIFHITTMFPTPGGPFFLQGFCASDGHFKLSTTLTNAHWDTFGNIHHALRGLPLATPSLDVSISTATLVVSSDTGLTLTIHEFSLGGFLAAEASVNFTSNGVLAHGDLSKPALFHGLELQNAQLRVFIPAASSGTASEITLTGEVAFLARTLLATTYIYLPKFKGPTSPSTLEWTVFAPMSRDEHLILVDLAPELRGSFLQDVAVHNPVLLIASCDEPHFPQELSIPPETVSKGIQVCAALGQFISLNALARSTTLDDLYLKAGWSPDLGFNLDVIVLSSTHLSLGHGTKVNPGHITIITSPRPSLILSASIDLPVSKQVDPLVFDAILSIDALSVSATGEMHGYWNNPFGISEHLKIGPSLALKVEVVLAQFLATGTPSGFGFSGNLQLGDVTAQLEFDVSETATGELLHGRLNALDIGDVVAFVADMGKLNMPQPPSFARFQSIDLYLSPLGATVGSKTYPAGASFSADVILFGVQGNVMASMDTTGFKLSGSIDKFQLGPFSVSGSDKTSSGPSVAIEFNPSQQRVLVEGLLKLFDVSAALQLTFDATPRPDFAVHFVLRFAGELYFAVDGALRGPPEIADLTRLDFALVAVFGQDILDYITCQLVAEFEKLHASASRDLQAAEADVARWRYLAAGGLVEAQGELDRARVAWDVKSTKRAESQRVIEDSERRREQLDADLRASREALQSMLAESSMDGWKATDTHVEGLKTVKDEADALQGKRSEPSKGTERLDVDIHTTVTHVQHGFNAHWQELVDGANGELANIDCTVHEAESAPWWNASAKASLPALYVDRLASEGELFAARSALATSKAILHSPSYLRTPNAIQPSRPTLPCPQEITRAAKEIPKNTPPVPGVVIGAPHSTLHTVESALTPYVAVDAMAVATAQQEVDDLEKCDEWRKYQAAITNFGSAEHTADQLKLAQTALSAANRRRNFLENMTTWGAKHSLDILRIKSVALFGSFHDFAHVKGHLVFDTVIDGTIVGQDFHMTPMLDLRDHAKFVGDICLKLWEDIQNETMKIIVA